MSNNVRDTQFQVYAKMLTDELIKYLTSRAGLTLDEIEQEWHKVIARRAYDLVAHVVGSLDSYAYDVAISGDELMERVPDLTKLPKEQEG